MTHLPLGSSPHTCLSLHPVPWVTRVPSQVVGSLDPHLPPPSPCPAHFIIQGNYSMSICYIGYYAYAVFHFYLAFLKSVLRVPTFFKSYWNAFNEGSSRSQRGSGCVHCPWFRQYCTGFPTIWKPGSQNRLILEPGFTSPDAVRRWGTDPSKGGQSEGRERRFRACQ